MKDSRQEGMGTGTRPREESEALSWPSGHARTGRWLCLAGATAGGLGILGGILGVRFLTTIVPGGPQMRPATALGLLLAGGAGALRCRVDAGRLRKGLVVLASLVAIAIGVGTLAEHALGVDLLLDRLIARSQTELHAGRPSPPTAVALTLLGAALLLFDVRPDARVRPSELLALSAWAIAFTALLGWVFGARAVGLGPPAPLIGASLPTAVGLFLTTLGLLFERPRAGLMRVATSPGPGGIQLRRLVVPVILAPTLLGLAVTSVLRAADTQDVSVVVPILMATMSLAGLFVLALTAISLNRTHEALESSRARTRSLLEQAPDGVFVADLDGRYTDVNVAGCRMLGYERDEIVGKTILDLVLPEDVARLWRSRERLSQGHPDVGEWMLRRRDGSLVAVEVSAKILPDGRWQGLVRDITERKQLERSLRSTLVDLRDSQERLELALLGGDLATWDWNVKTGEVIFNARWAEMRGLRPEQVKPHVESWTAGVHPDDMPGVQEALADHFRGLTEKYSAEHRVRTRSGEWLWISDVGKVVARDDRGEPVRMVGVEVDVTERKRLETELRVAEAKASGILSVSIDAIISCDGDQRITLFNEGAEKIFGYSKSEAIGAPLEMLIPEASRAAHRQHVQRFAAGEVRARRMGERGSLISGLRKNGQAFPADAAISTLDVAGGKMLTVVLRDITEQKRAEKDQDFLAELGSVLVSPLDLEDTLRAAARLTVGHLADYCLVEALERRGQPHLVAVGHRDPGKAAVAHQLEQLQLEASLFDPKRPLLTSEVTPEDLDSMAGSEGHRRWLRELGPRSLMAVPVASREEVIGSIAVISASDDRSYSERDRRLLEKVAVRTAMALEKARLYRIAQHAVQTRDEVLGIVAHDLRNPLGAILIQTALLRQLDHEAADGARRPSEVIERAARRMNRLIQDLLDVARMEAGRLSVEQAAVSGRQAVLDSVAAQGPLAASGSLELRLALAENLPDVWADRDRLVQIFENLIGNAIKFTRAGGHITVGAAPKDGQVLFWVSDTGTGIATEDLPQVFGRFWQARRSGRQGAGLGLPIVKGIVDAHGGRIWVESAVGQGSTFFFTIPAAARAEVWRPALAPIGA
jgi:PAS domain S-box-containing protein